MQVLKCMYITLLGFVLEVSMSLANRDETDKFQSSQLLKAFSKARFGKRTFPSEPPQYMLDLYNEVADSKGVTKSPLPHGASLVRAVPVQGIHEHRFSFLLEKIPEEENILEAEVHIFHHQLNGSKRRLLELKNMFMFTLRVVDELGDTTLALKQTVAGHFGGWRVFSVGEAVREARATDRKITFVVEATTLEGNPIPAKIQHGRHSTNNPLLVLFNEVTNGTGELLRGPDLSHFKGSYHDSSDFSAPTRLRRSVEEPTSIPEIPSGCELQSLLVNFAKIGWSWVVYPTEYDAHHCVGRCAFPLGQELNPTNHATVISIVHYSSSQVDDVENPSCVPTAYDSLALLYYDEEETVILKQFDRMVASQCGCR